jgi:BASS family bile acid:Na+ symporter
LVTFISVIIPSITFLLLVAVGLDLTRADFEPVWRRPGLIAAGLAGPLLILPVLSLGLITAFDPPPAVTAGILLITACPIGGVSNTYSYLARASAALSVTLTALSCLVAVFTIPLLTRVFEAALGQPLGFEAPVGTLLLQLSGMLVAPIATGMYIRARWPEAAVAHRPAVQRAAFAGLAVLVIVVVWAQFDAFRDGLAATVPLAVAFVVSAFGVGWVVGRVVARDVRDRFTLAMEFATRNVAIATAIAVSILGRVDFAVFATTYFLSELPLALAAVVVFRRTFARAA